MVDVVLHRLVDSKHYPRTAHGHHTFSLVYPLLVSGRSDSTCPTGRGWNARPRPIGRPGGLRYTRPREF